jgi:hypothetical protein
MERAMIEKLRPVVIILLSIITFVVIAPGPAMGIVVAAGWVWDGLVSAVTSMWGWFS